MKKKIAIIGAGISGLVIAYEMVNAWKRSKTTTDTTNATTDQW